MRIKSSAVLGSTLVCVVLGAAAGGWWLWQKNLALADDNAQLQSDLTSLRNEARSSGNSTGTGNTLGSSNTDTASSESRSMLVKDFGIKFNVPASLTDLSFAESPPASGMLQLTTQTLQSAYPSCAAPGILGALFRYPKGQPLPASTAAGKAQPLVAAGSYQYYYLPLDKNPCASNKTAVDAVAKATSQLRDSLKTLAEQ